MLASSLIARARRALRSWYARGNGFWSSSLLALAKMKPGQLLILGFTSYALIGVTLLSLPVARHNSVAVLDNTFNVVSAISTTGLTAISVADNYTLFGQVVIFCLFQFGGIGYMTVSSAIILARGGQLSDTRRGILRAEFALPHDIDLQRFVLQVAGFTLAIETVGTAILYTEFKSLGIAQPFWSALFHCVSAFATAGFGLYNDSLEQFRDNGLVCATIGVLCYLGAIGFIVIQDAWCAARSRRHQITFTSKVILVLSALIFLIATPVVYFTEPMIADFSPGERFSAAAFQVMSASSTAGFNTVSIANLAPATLAVLTLVMIVGASPSGTGGGIKTTTVSSLLAVLASMLRGRARVLFFRHEVPLARILSAVASATLYLSFLSGSVVLLCFTQRQEFLSLAFEAASALGTVGLSMGITGNLTDIGKLLVTALMFVGRIGPLTIGLALFRQDAAAETETRRVDLAV